MSMTESNAHDETPLADIPRPEGRLPLLGDALRMDAERPTRSMMDLADELGPVYSLVTPGHDTIVVSGGDAVEECLDESRFEKNNAPELVAMREIAGDAIFTSWTREPAWKKAHNILLPAFAPQAIKGYTEKMADIADQLVLKWARLNPGDPVDIGTDMTKLTFDTICLVCFSYRPGSFYREGMPPTVTAIEEAIAECVNRPSRLPGQDIYEAIKGRSKYKENLSVLNNLADKIIEDRIRSAEVGKNGDVLDLMLTQADKDTGEKLTRLSIRQQMITFLAAGYDTTSGMLMWTIYYLIKNPEVLAKCYAEVDEVFGDDLSVLPTETQIPKLQYVLQCMKEALRLGPNNAGFQVRPLDDEVIDGKYRVKKGQAIHILTPQLQRNPAWFPEPEKFDPDRFTPELEASRPAWAWMPFGSGQRACIGRHFSFYESQLLLGLILQRFDLIDSFDYQLDVEDFFSIKPKNLSITVRPRAGRETSVIAGPRTGVTSETEAETPASSAAAQRVVSDYGGGNPILVLHGSNLGTSERIATEIAEDGRARGFAVRQGPLDDYVDALPKDGLVVICASSYNGNPPDNALKFHRWLSGGLAPDALAGVTYTVFGAGDRVWATTFQKVPAEIDEMLESAGAQRFCPRGIADASDDFDGMFRDWYAAFWQQAGAALGLAPQTEVPTDMNRYEIAPTGKRLHGAFFSSLDATAFRLAENRELLTRVVQNGPVPQSTRHIEFELPEGASYRTGDHIALLPRNSAELIGRAAALAELDLDELVMIRSNTGAPSHLPLDTPFVVSELLAARVELQAPMTRAQIRILAEFATDGDEQAELVALAADENVTRYREQILFKRVSLLDIVQRYRSVDVPLNTCLDLLPGLAPRYYSISSSPTVSPKRCSITVGVLQAPARNGEGIYHGTSSNFLARTEPGAMVPGFIRPPGLPFDVPEDPATPMIMIATGTGLSPFRGFLQERAAQGASADLGPSLLIYGCRLPDSDFIYEDEIRQFETDGIVTIVPAYSRIKDGSRVQDAVRAHAEQILELIARGGITYVCGGAGTVAPALRDAFAEIYQRHSGVSAEDATAWLEQQRTENRYLEDVWAAH